MNESARRVLRGTRHGQNDCRSNESEASDSERLRAVEVVYVGWSLNRVRVKRHVPQNEKCPA